LAVIDRAGGLFGFLIKRHEIGGAGRERNRVQSVAGGGDGGLVNAGNCTVRMPTQTARAVRSFHLFPGEISSGIFIGRYIELPFCVSAFLSRKAIATALLVARKQITGSTRANRIARARQEASRRLIRIRA